MKRIISALIICTMLFALVLAIPASAATPKEQLKEQLDIAATYTDATIYSKATWDHLQETIAAAQEAYDNATVSDLIVNMQVSALKSAIAGLRVDTTPIDSILTKIEEAEKASNDIKKMGYPQGDFTEASWAALQTAIADAKVAKTSNDVETIAAGAAALQAAFDALEYNPIPSDITKKLAELLELADILLPEDFSDSAWGMVVIKVEQAEAVANDKRLSSNVIAATQLETALKNLTEDKVLPTPPVLDYSYMDKLIAFIDTLGADMFTEESWANLQTAYDNAKKVRETTKKQAELHEAYLELENARKTLVLAPKPVETDPPATEPAATQTPAEDPAGCGGTIAIGATVVVAVLGTAVVLKKKEN